MAFTGLLGTADSQLGNLLLGEEGGEAVGTQTLEMRANILSVEDETLQMRANIMSANTQTLQMRANIQIGQTLQMRANIRIPVQLQMRACISVPVEADLTMLFDAVTPLDQWLMVRYQVGDKEPNYKTIQMRANILQQVTADLSVRFEVDYPWMPTDCISRPTTRVYLRTVRQFQMRARIVNN